MNKPLTKFGLILAAISATLVLQGCSGILTSDQPAKQYYLLMPYAPSPAPVGVAPAATLALDVTAIPGLDTDRILALDANARLNHYGNARWPDHLPEVLTSVMRRSLESTGRFTAVHSSDHAAGNEWLLQLEVREFYGLQAASGDTSSVHVSLAGILICNDASHPLSLDDSHPVAEQRLAAVVAAHQAGLNAVTRQLIERLGQLCRPGS